MPVLHNEPIPHLSDACVPPEVIGMAVLTTVAMHGANADALAAMIDQFDVDPAARLYDTSIAFQLDFRRAEGLGVQDQAIAASPLFRVRRESRKQAAIRVLALVAPGELMVNTPLDFITNYLDARLDMLFVLPGQPLPATIPDHDIMFLADGEADAAMVDRLHRLFVSWPRPALNDLAYLPRLARDRLPPLLAGLPGICSPPTVEASRTLLDDLLRDGGDIGDILPGCSYPVLVRPLGSHAGTGLKKMDSAADLESYLVFSFATSYFVTKFVDYRSDDGLYRKYRIAFIDRQPHLCHMATSQKWMVHYLNAGMAESQDKRDGEARAMAEFATTFAARHAMSFAALHERLPFDYYSIDCSELPDGRLLIFEADTAAIIHLMDPEEMYPYKHAHMRGVFDAFGDMLTSRATPLDRRVPRALARA
jgi:hypothetical protein